MKFRVALISAFFTLFAFGAQAQSIILADGSSGVNTTIIRGAPQRCHGKQPLVINVAQALRDGNQSQQNCKVHYKRAGQRFNITNIVVVAPYYERVYIKQ